MSKLIQIDCPQCGRKIGIPAAVSETIHVTCPACGEQWDWGKQRRRKQLGGGEKWKRFEAFADRVLLRSMVETRNFLAPRKFTGVHIVIAVIGGSVFGFIIGIVEGQSRAERFVHPAPASAPAQAETNAAASTNQPSQP
ncbi:MAG TPA: hypothetical protein VGO67_20030 [Verrucomicrobiae bacterium]|jgi:predicted RNA-binding Zn-ribbon protein involved in translation (DUF1610 family)